jgi:hypothetical protein
MSDLRRTVVGEYNIANAITTGAITEEYLKKQLGDVA